MLYGTKPREVLEAVSERNIPVLMSYQAQRRWQLARVLLGQVDQWCFEATISPRRKLRAVELEVGQSVGMSLQYGYGGGYDRFVFDTKVIAVETSRDPMDGRAIIFAIPEEVELVQRRSYVRVAAPAGTDVNVDLVRRCDGDVDDADGVDLAWSGRLVDISAGGLQVAIDSSEKGDFARGQVLGVRFTPMSYETPLAFSARVKSILPTADNTNVCIGLEMIGLEASPEGRLILQRLCNVVDQYLQIGQSQGREEGI